MTERVAELRRARYGGRANDREVYARTVAALLRPGLRVVDVGCGRGREDRMRWEDLPPVELIGLDPDPAARENPDLAAFHVLPERGPWPLESARADLVISRYALEHVAAPAAFFAEAARVLVPGGRFVFLTPNRYYPPMIASRILPHRVKQRLLERTGHSAGEDVFPTYYRANTARAIARLAADSGMDTERLTVREYVPTRYLDWTLPGFLAACAYHETITRLGLERWIGASIVGVLRKR